MIIKDIYSFINNPIIVSRGAEYYKNNKVIQFNQDIYDGSDDYYDEFESDTIIKALVSGTAYRPYNVKITLDEDEEIEDAHCDCPYFQDNFNYCKHIAAVLFYYVTEKQIVENPVILDKNKFEDDEIIELEKHSIEKKDSFTYINYIKKISNPVQGIIKNQKYKLIFSITYNSYEYIDEWLIEPKLRYVKKDGQLGRFEKFKDYKLTESISDLEKILLYRLTEKEEQKNALIHHINFLINNKIPDLYLNEDHSDMPILLEEIKKLNIRFVLSGFNSYKGFYEFIPVIEAVGNKGNIIDNITEPSRIILDGCTIIILAVDGKIFYKENHQLYYTVLKAFKKNNFKLTYEEIKELKVYYKNKNLKEINFIFKQEIIRKVSPVPKPFIEIALDYKGIQLTLFFNYNGVDIPHYNVEMGNKDSFVSFRKNEKESIILIQRNRDYEKKINQFFQFQFKSIISPLFKSGFYKVDMEQLDFLAQYGNKILEEGIEIRIKGEKEKITKRTGNISISVNSGIDWFDIQAGYLDSDGNVKDIQIDLALLYHGVLQIDNSYTIIKKEDIQKLKLLLQEGMAKDGKLKVSKYNFHIINELYHDISNNQDSEITSIYKISQKLKNFQKIKKHVLPQKFHGNLREYQKAGYNWLHFLNKYNLNGCLADDMGLGKTVQLLSLLQKLKEDNKLSTSLIVVPVTTITNWESEILKFTPSLKYLLHFGQNRIKDEKHFKKHDAVLVSYHTLRNDIQVFNKIDYNYIILDESQNIKNYKSLVFKAVRTLKADCRLSLTGTPVENNTLELWSQMEFLNPGLLGSVEKFKKEFTNPIEVKKDHSATDRLRKLIFPFLLRRKKEDVLKDLPEKSEIILYSQMDKKQEKAYIQQREYYRALISGLLDEEGRGKAGIKILAALLKLRQAALFPEMSNKKFKDIPSCKFDQLTSIANEILEENHKILIFSQFVESLSRIKKYFDNEKVKYSYIDGSISALNRKKAIDDFQKKDKIKIFLLSLKAGGVGVNLTAADYVVIFDPWWNPAVEAQAIGRAHRIGQKRKVIVYKMIVKDTIEEKMLKLQDKKKNLVKDLITTESSFFKSLSKNDIIDLFN